MRLIDADELRNKFIGWLPKDGEEWESGIHPLENLSVSALMEIDEAPTIEAVEVLHGEWLEVHEHMWKRDENGEIDEWRWENGYHNGPVCKLCYYSPCIHCEPDYESTKCRVVSYKCSICGAHKEEKTDFCPHCGADMRKGDAE